MDVFISWRWDHLWEALTILRERKELTMISLKENERLVQVAVMGLRSPTGEVVENVKLYKIGRSHRARRRRD